MLHEVPLLYGRKLYGDGVIADVHRREMLRKNRGGLYGDYDKRQIARLPYERVLGVLVIAGFALKFFGKYLPF